MHYQLIDAKGSLLEEGDATINVTKELVLITPKQGQPFPIKLTDIQSILEPIAYSIAIVLKDGSKIQMSQLGNMRTQILAQINDLKQTNAKESFLLVGIGNPDKFKGLTNGVKSDVFLYDDALVSLPYEGDPIQFLYSFVDNIEVDQSGYNIQITLHDGSQIKLSQFAQFTQSMIRVLNQKVSDVKVRTSSFLSSLLPGLTALQVRSLAMELRDGVLAPVSKLNAIDPTVFQVLSDAACLNERKECLDQLIKLGTSWIGFKQVISVEKKGTGGQPWQDATHQPILDHGGQYSGPQGLAGAMMAGLISQGPPWGAGYGFQGPFFERGSDLAYEMLGMRMGAMRMGAMGMGAMGMGAMGMGAMGAQNQHQIAERKIPQIANMTAKSSDYSKLTVGGQRPSILCFICVQTNDGQSIFEVLNDSDEATYIFDNSIELTKLNSAIALIDFRLDALSDDSSLSSSLYGRAINSLENLKVLKTAFISAVSHDNNWQSNLTNLIK